MWYVVMLLWGVVGLVWPKGPARLVPRRWRGGYMAGWVFVGGLGIVWLAIGWSAGVALATPDVNQTRLGFGFALILGGPVTYVTYRVWRAANGIVLGLAPYAWRLPPLEQVTLAPDVTGGTPLPRGPQLGPWEAHRADRGLRRLRGGLVALIIAAYWAARAAQLFVGDDAASLALVCVVGLGALWVVRGLIAHRHRMSGGALSIPAAARLNGWRLSGKDGSDLANAFPGSPILRSSARGDRVVQELTIHATSGHRAWWAVQQHARLTKRTNRLATPDRRATWMVWLPGVRLQPVLITSRDNVGVRDWLTGSVRLESETFNQRLFAYARPGTERDAVAVLHPRMMELLLTRLPDGATLFVADDYVCVWRDGPMHGADLCTHASLALQVADLIPGFLLNERTTPEAAIVRTHRGAGATEREHSRPNNPPAPIVVNWINARVFASPRAAADTGRGERADLIEFLYDVRCTAGDWLAQHANGRSLRILMSIGIDARGDPGYWCENAGGEGLRTDELTSLVDALRDVPAPTAADDPVAFTIAVSVNDPTATEADFTDLPTPWADAMTAAGRPLSIPDELFDWMWTSARTPAE